MRFRKYGNKTDSKWDCTAPGSIEVTQYNQGHIEGGGRRKKKERKKKKKITAKQLS